MKLNLYLVILKDPTDRQTAYLVVAESVGRVEVAMQNIAGYDDRLEGVGLLGPYNPDETGFKFTTLFAHGSAILGRVSGL